VVRVSWAMEKALSPQSSSARPRRSDLRTGKAGSKQQTTRRAAGGGRRAADRRGRSRRTKRRPAARRPYR
jgi:hypothetical protein